MNKLSHFIIYSRVATAIAALLCMGIWIYTIVQGHTGGALSYLNLTLYLVFGVLIGNTGKRTDNGSRKIVFPATIFYMSCAINPQLAPWQEGTICLMLMAVAYYILLGTYRKHAAMSGYFAAFALIGIASLHCPQLLYLVPVLILCSSVMQSLHLRTALAALLGVALPYWTAFCILFLTDSTHLIQDFTDKLTTNTAQAIPQLSIPIGEGSSLAVPMIALQTIWTLLLVVPATVHHLLANTSKVRNRANRHMQIGFLTTLLIAALILPSLYTALQPAIVSLSAILSYSFFTTEKRGQNIWLITLLFIWLFIIGLYVWNNSSTF